ncbi:MAG: hypothetical protein WA125_02155 [Desulfosporosinus sp.]
MDVNDLKQLDSLLGNLKGELLSNLNDKEISDFVEWAQKKLTDTIKDRKEKKILKQLKNCNPDERPKLLEKKRKYLPKNYPYNLRIGDLVHVNFGFGYCSELSDGHYAIILSDIKANMYLILPLSSEPLRLFELYLDDLGLPCKNTSEIEKRSYFRFDQLRFVHYRRLENINGYGRKNIGETNLGFVQENVSKFLKIYVDK